jgi:hypothetical protein
LRADVIGRRYFPNLAHPVPVKGIPSLGAVASQVLQTGIQIHRVDINFDISTV